MTDIDNDRTTAKPARPLASASPQLRRGIAGVLAVLCVLAAVAIVLEVVNLRPKHDEQQATIAARSDVVRAAERFTVAVNNYDANTFRDKLTTITPMLSPKFKGEFEKAQQDILPSIEQAKVESKGQVLTSAVASVDPDSAQVLVVADAQVKSVFDTRARHFRWEISLVKLDGKWLVDDFSPVD